MFNYNDIIEYLDGTYDENFNEARNWANNNQASFDELIEKRIKKEDGLHRFFQIVKYPEPEPYIPTIEEQNEEIRQKREQEYIKTSDYLKDDYLEAWARNEANAEEKKQLWLASKDKIRADNPYIKE